MATFETDVGEPLTSRSIQYDQREIMPNNQPSGQKSHSFGAAVNVSLRMSEAKAPVLGAGFKLAKVNILNICLAPS